MSSEILLDGLLCSYYSRKSVHEKTKEFKHLQLLLSSLVDEHQSNSTIVIGPPGAGKTTFVNAAIAAITSSSTGLRDPKVIRLSGLLSRDLRTSILTLTRSLKLHSDFGTLLGDGQNFDERLGEVLQLLRTSFATKFKSTPLIIVLDRVDLFAEQRAQALLYNLLDIVQKKETPLLVIGVTTRVDILELLEKRVKSRFSHRSLFLPPTPFPVYSEFLKHLLTPRSNNANNELWNEHVGNLLELPIVQANLRCLYSFDHTVGTLVHFASDLLVRSGEGFPSTELVEVTLSHILGKSRLQQALDLSETEMLMMLAVYRAIKRGNPAFNFSTLQEILGKIMGGQKKTREDLFVAFRSLLKQEFLEAVDGKNAGEDKFYKSQLRVEEFPEIFKAYPHLPTFFQTQM